MKEKYGTTRMGKPGRTLPWTTDITQGRAGRLCLALATKSISAIDSGKFAPRILRSHSAKEGNPVLVTTMNDRA